MRQKDSDSRDEQMRILFLEIKSFAFSTEAKKGGI